MGKTADRDGQGTRQFMSFRNESDYLPLTANIMVRLGWTGRELLEYHQGRTVAWGVECTSVGRQLRADFPREVVHEFQLLHFGQVWF